LEIVADFPAAKTVRQDTTFTMQSTTFSPQKHHKKSPFFLKTPCKNAELASQKKNCETQLKSSDRAG
jgi:hypothetical protein